MNARQTTYQRPRPEQPALVAVPLDVRLMHGLSSLLLVALLLGGLAAGAWALLRLSVFSIQRITVVGEVRHNNPLTIQANVAGKLQGNFFTADLGQIKQAFEAVPWVREARVEREFPNRLLVTLQEHRPAAFWGDDADARLVNSFGEVFEINLDELDDRALVRLQGPDNQSQQAFEMFNAIRPVFEKMNLNVRRLMLTDRGSWRVVLSQGAAVELGRGSIAEVMPRLERLTKTLSKVTQQLGRNANAMESADLRYDNGYAIRLRGVSTTETAGKT